MTKMSVFVVFMHDMRRLTNNDGHICALRYENEEKID
jgi:hypothetical protein